MSYGFFDGQNTLLTGSARQLDDLVENDVFRASITVLGEFALVLSANSPSSLGFRCCQLGGFGGL
jgi:hypothetical protein